MTCSNIPPIRHYVVCPSCGRVHEVLDLENYWVHCSCGRIIENSPELRALDISTIWSREWPRVPGKYWFWGVRWTSFNKETPKMHLVEVVLMGEKKTPAHVCEGAFLYEAEGARGWWTPAFLPNPPEGVMTDNTLFPEEHLWTFSTWGCWQVS